ncbi:beta-ketoacyl synthase N-terminal-like domain-containing protein [Mesorhizobium sp. B1-1-5]|uniref:beta-ketoacyl synthase N-terminal-like domain-containing protein n=1 Tax=Mesorhizobium sp. B1-1-5 TaxID=2589979 RepID=UPI00112B02B4|nr:beta-ketoacyl synthase N-terminal-like domain-containing protein [Mesorhizobium sp. B1-1-5]TPO11127.1 3-oxoacyl-ACP synthase [Mesorhizobium sp. B1-1-5]
MTAGVDILSVGMVTAVGLSSAAACAAMRGKIDGFQETDFVAPGGEWLIGAPVPLPRKWQGEKRLAHIAAAAICEALDAVPQARGQVALLLCTAEEDRPARPIVNDSELLWQVAKIAEIELHASSRIIAHGRPSGHVALEHARKMIEERSARYVLVAGVDSFLGSRSIAHYLKQKRLLIAGNSNGFIPGEAAAAFLCGPSAGGNFHLMGVGLAREEGSILNHQDIPLRGDGMVQAYGTALAQARIGMNQIGYRIADLIGEQYWFSQSTLASIRLLRGDHGFQDLWSPNEFVGNVGAAATPLMVGMAWTAAQKGYAAGNPVLIESSSDNGVCGAAIFAKRAA